MGMKNHHLAIKQKTQVYEMLKAIGEENLSTDEEMAEKLTAMCGFYITRKNVIGIRTQMLGWSRRASPGRSKASYARRKQDERDERDEAAAAEKRGPKDPTKALRIQISALGQKIDLLNIDKGGVEELRLSLKGMAVCLSRMDKTLDGIGKLVQIEERLSRLEKNTATICRSIGGDYQS